jgi:hypothetical protein
MIARGGQTEEKGTHMIWPFPRASLFRSIPSPDAYLVVQLVDHTLTLRKYLRMAHLSGESLFTSLVSAARCHPGMVHGRLSDISPGRLNLCCSM